MNSGFILKSCEKESIKSQGARRKEIMKRTKINDINKGRMINKTIVVYDRPGEKN